MQEVVLEEFGFSMSEALKPSEILQSVLLSLRRRSRGSRGDGPGPVCHALPEHRPLTCQGPLTPRKAMPRGHAVRSLRECRVMSGAGGTPTHTDRGGKVSSPGLRLETRGRRKQAATLSGTDIPLSPTKLNPPPPPPRHTHSPRNDTQQQQQVTQRTWHWTPVVLYGTQPVFLENPRNGFCLFFL